MQNTPGSYIISTFPSDPFYNFSKENSTENENCQRKKIKQIPNFILFIF